MFKLKAKLTQTYESSPSPGWPFQASVPLPEEAHSPGLPLHHSDPRLRGGGILSSQRAALVTRDRGERPTFSPRWQAAPSLQRSDSHLLYHMMVQIRYSFSSDVYT